MTAASSYMISIEPRDSATLTFVFAGSTRSSGSGGETFTLHRREATPSLLERKKAHYAALHPTGPDPDPRPAAAAGLRLGPDQQRVAGPGRAGDRTRTRRRSAGISLVVRHRRRLLPARPDRDRRLRSGQGRRCGCSWLNRTRSTATAGSSTRSPPTAGVQSGQHPGDRAFHHDRGKVVRWTGDLAFAREMYPAMKQGLRWLLVDMDQNRNLFPGGYGDHRDLRAQRGADRCRGLYPTGAAGHGRHRHRLGHRSSAARYRQQAEELKRRINDRFWLEDEGSYADFYGTRAQAISAAEGVDQADPPPG